MSAPWNAPRRPERLDIARLQRVWDEIRREEGLADCLTDPDEEREREMAE